jgi:hypothetical protein
MKLWRSSDRQGERCGAAVHLQERYIDETQRDPSLRLKVGIGIDAGEAIPFEGGYRGRALNLAARLKDQARAGQVLATEALIHLAGQVDGLVYIERGFVHPKGVALPVHVVEVLAEGRQPAETDSAYESELRTFLFSDIKATSPLSPSAATPRQCTSKLCTPVSSRTVSVSAVDAFSNWLVTWCLRSLCRHDKPSKQPPNYKSNSSEHSPVSNNFPSRLQSEWRLVKRSPREVRTQE